MDAPEAKTPRKTGFLDLPVLALALAFVVELAAAIAFALRPPSVMWAALLAISWSAGLAIFSRRCA